jgi:voltage-gated potassium channel
MYWAIVTLTTVGYGDVIPMTVPGQMLSAVLMILGYGIIAIPTGIVTAELTSVTRPHDLTTRTCPSCLSVGHLVSARFCRDCGETLLNSRNGDPTTLE